VKRHESRQLPGHGYGEGCIYSCSTKLSVDIDAVPDHVVAYSAEVAHRAVPIRQSFWLLHDTGCMLQLTFTLNVCWCECFCTPFLLEKFSC